MTITQFPTLTGAYVAEPRDLVKRRNGVAEYAHVIYVLQDLTAEVLRLRFPALSEAQAASIAHQSVIRRRTDADESAEKAVPG